MKGAKVAAGTLTGMMEAALEIAAARRQVLADMRAALETGDEAKALKFAKRLCGLAEDDE